MEDKALMSGHDGVVEVTFKDDIAILTMKCGENRFNELFVEKMNNALDEVLRNSDVKALITTSVGKFYSNGLDLGWLTYLAKNDPEHQDNFLTEANRNLFNRFMKFPMPTIALVNGHAFAAGAIHVLLHDHVIMQNTKGWWCLNEVHINLKFHKSNTELFKLKLPEGETFHQAAILGRRYTGNEAKAAGIVHESCAPKDMLPRALAWIDNVLPPGGYDRQHLQDMKEDVYKSIFDAQSAPSTGSFRALL